MLCACVCQGAGGWLVCKEEELKKKKELIMDSNLRELKRKIQFKKDKKYLL